jgi:multidrug efflux pump subunit AcrA (membrane-fusion protein)
VVAEELTSAITLSGTIRRAHIVGVSAPVPGYIDVILANVGEEVYAGPELARIGNDGLESDRAQATAAVAQAEARLDATESGHLGATGSLARR